jgi:hypothetical protein
MVTPSGYFAKKLNADSNLPSLFYKLFVPYRGYQAPNADLPERFGSLACMLISSGLGGGLWDTTHGKELLEYLKENYPYFYKAWPNMLLGDPEETFNLDNIFQVNNWLMDKARVSQPKDLLKLCPSDMDDLFALQSRAQSDVLVEAKKSRCCILQ